jgi:hypothetical protein
VLRIEPEINQGVDIQKTFEILEKFMSFPKTIDFYFQNSNLKIPKNLFLIS